MKTTPRMIKNTWVGDYQVLPATASALETPRFPRHSRLIACQPKIIPAHVHAPQNPSLQPCTQYQFTELPPHPPSIQRKSPESPSPPFLVPEPSQPGGRKPLPKPSTCMLCRCVGLHQGALRCHRSAPRSYSPPL